MKKILLILLLLQSIIFANQTDVILEEIKQLRIDTNKRFEVMQKNMDKRFDQVDKRFEQVDRRFEQVDKRFDTVFNILYILMGLVFASPFIAIYLRDKKEESDRKNFDIVKGLLYTMRELAQDDEKIARSLRASNLM